MGDLLLLNIDKSGNQVYMQEFGSYGFDEGYSIIEDSLNNVYVLGSKVVGDTVIGDIGLDLIDFYLIKANSDGEIQWEKTYNFSINDNGLSILQKNQDTLIIFGTVGLEQQNLLFLKVDSAGNKINEVLYDEDIQGSVSALKTTKDSILIGYTSNYAIKLKQLDFNGNESWTKTFKSQYGQKFCNSIKQTVDSGYILVGETDAMGYGNSGIYNTNDNIYLLKLDKYYDVTWEKAYGYEREEHGLDVVQTNDNGFLISGQTLWDYGKYGVSFFLKTTLSGDSLWTKEYGISSKSYLNKIIPINNGFYGIGGVFINNDWDVLVVRTDFSGDIDTSYIPTSINQLSFESNSLLIYPNPATDKLFYKIQDSGENDIFSIYNFNGQLIQSGKIMTKEGYIDLSSIRSNLVLIRFVFKDKEIIKKLIIKQ